MLVNAFVPHITASILAKKPVPGLMTAIVNVLVFGFILIWAILHQIISLRTLFYSTLTVGGAILLIMLFSFRIFRLSGKNQEV